MNKGKAFFKVIRRILILAVIVLVCHYGYNYVYEQKDLKTECSGELRDSDRNILKWEYTQAHNLYVYGPGTFDSNEYQKMINDNEEYKDIKPKKIIIDNTVSNFISPAQEGDSDDYLNSSQKNFLYRLRKIVVDEESKNLFADEHGVLFNKNKSKLLMFPTRFYKFTYSFPRETKDIRRGANCSGNPIFSGNFIIKIRLSPNTEFINKNTFCGMDLLMKIETTLNNKVFYTDESGVLYKKLKNDELELYKFPNLFVSWSYSLPENFSEISPEANCWCKKNTPFIKECILPERLEEDKDKKDELVSRIFRLGKIKCVKVAGESYNSYYDINS